MKKMQLMAIINLTPDSFFDGGKYNTLKQALSRIQTVIDEGADILDIGAVSSRPGAREVSFEEEKERLIPVLKELQNIKIPISIDTTDPRIAQEALSLGASYINDIYGFENPLLRAVVKEHNAKICVMHMQGTPKTMQNHPYYPRGIMTELSEWFEKRIDLLLKEKFLLSNIIIDPGIGFGKTEKDCLTIIRNIAQLRTFGLPILMGLSRKSFMSKILQKPSTQLLSTTIALNTMSILEGVEIVRVHDVKEHRDVIDLLSAF